MKLCNDCDEYPYCAKRDMPYYPQCYRRLERRFSLRKDVLGLGGTCSDVDVVDMYLGRDLKLGTTEPDEWLYISVMLAPLIRWAMLVPEGPAIVRAAMEAGDNERATLEWLDEGE